MPGASRDRVTIDLRGIGDAVIAAAAGQGVTVSQMARKALVASMDPCSTSTVAWGSDRQTPGRPVAKLTLRLPQVQAEALILKSGILGLSYGEYVARLVEGGPMPQPVQERQADRRALLASTDQLATLSADLNALVAMLRHGKTAQAQEYRQRLDTADAEIHRHLDRASALIARL
jgi:hypothetical protein